MNCRTLTTAAVLTNPLVYAAALLGLALTLVGLGVLLLWGIYRYLRAECGIPQRTYLVPPTITPPEPADSVTVAAKDAPLDVAVSPWGVELPAPKRLTPEESVLASEAERAFPGLIADPARSVPARVEQAPPILAAEPTVVTRARVSSAARTAKPTAAVRSSPRPKTPAGKKAKARKPAKARTTEQ